MTVGSARTSAAAASGGTGRTGLAGALLSVGAGIRAPARRFRAAEEAVAAIEFGLILPLLLTIMLGGTQVIAYINATRKVELIARSVSQMISQATPSGSATVATVSAADLHFSYDAALVLFPYAMKEAQRQGKSWWQIISINYASIQFTQTSSTCTNSTDQSACYRANVVWTSTGTAQPAAGDNYRPCVAPQLPAGNTAPPNRTTLPLSVYGPASLIVIDVVFTFTPTFGTRFVPPITISRTAYVQPRYATLVNYDATTSDGIAVKCLGY